MSREQISKEYDGHSNEVPFLAVDDTGNGPEGNYGNQFLDVGAQDGRDENTVSDEVRSALDHLSRWDVVDAYGQRLRGYSSAAARLLTMSAIPAAYTGIISKSLLFGPQTAAGVAVITAAGAAVSTAAYIAQRYREDPKAQESNDQQSVVRRDVGDWEVDIIRQRRKLLDPRTWRRTMPTMYWHGANPNHGNKSDDFIIDKFVGAVDSAQRYRLPKFVVHKAILDVAARQSLQSEDDMPVAAMHDDKTTTNEKLIAATKGVRIRDKNNTAPLLELSTDEAVALAEKVRSHGKVARIEALASWLVETDPGHPLASAFADWKRLGKSPEMEKRFKTILQASLERHYSNTTLAEPITVVYADEDYDYGAAAEPATESSNPSAEYDPVMRVRLRPQRTVRLNHTGLDITGIADIDGEPPRTQYGKDSFSQLAGENINDHVERMLERRSQLTRKHEDAFPLEKQEIWKLELALYYSLIKRDDELVDGRAVQRAGEFEAAGTLATLYDRVLAEKPRTLPRPSLARRGNVAEKDQRLTYQRLKRQVAYKAGAIAATAAIGFGVGHGAIGAGWEYSGLWSYHCEPGTFATVEPLDEKEQQWCDEHYYPGMKIIEAGADGVINLNSALENEVLLHAYNSGVLTPDVARYLLTQVGREWAQDKLNDLGSRANLYGGADSYVTDVSQESDKNPTLWSLQPLNGASTEGYWPANIQNHVTIDTGYADDNALPPLADSTVRFDRSPLLNSIAPIGFQPPSDTLYEDYFRVSTDERIRYYRPLDLPTTITDYGQMLIGVNGRQLINSGELVSTGPNFDYSDAKWVSYSLPVLEGADMVAFSVTLKDLVNDAAKETPPYIVYQQTNGTFHLAMPQTEEQGYLDIQYWLDPKATTELPLVAESEITVQQRGETSLPLSEALDLNDVAALRAELGVSPDAALDEILKAVQNTREYSFTPYDQDLPYEPLIAHNNVLPTSTLLAATAEYAARLDTANCNVADFIAIIATRGTDGDTILNHITGSRNDGDNALTQAESHAWMLTNDPERPLIDVTPQAAEDIEVRETDPYVDNPDPTEDLGHKTTETAKLIAMLALGYGGIRAYGAVAPRLQRRLNKYLLVRSIQALANAEESGMLNSDLHIINHVLHSAPDDSLDEKQLPAYMKADSSVDLGLRLSSISKLDPEGLKAALTNGTNSGHLMLSDDTQRRLLNIVSHAHRIRPIL